MFFSEEKNQKTFTSRSFTLAGNGLPLAAVVRIKVFCFFSSEKKAFFTHST
jgi:hypothetical protein